MTKRILAIDDDSAVHMSLTMALEPRYEVVTATSGTEALSLFHARSPDLVLLDIIIPGQDGLALLRAIRNERPRVPVIMLTAMSSPKTAVTAMKLGADDFLTKPFDVEELRLVVDRCLTARALEQEVHDLRAQVGARYAFHNLIGKSPAMQEVYAKIGQVADTRTTVVITGESGTGKELAARALHFNSSRRDRPFVGLNCAALPETLIETELFGHEKGAFTDAHGRRIGQFELAHGGTLFLDEITELSLTMQAKLLRVLQERELKRIGGAQAIKVDVRIIAATNRNLLDEVAKGRFREDMYYRINVVSLFLPPLRERRQDIPQLAEHFLATASREAKRGPHGFSKAALEALARYDWPGNVRELQNVVEQTMIWCARPLIMPDDLPEAIRNHAQADKLRTQSLSGQLSLIDAVLRFERDIILDALRRRAYVQTHAAALLGISRRQLKYRMDALGISGPGPVGADEKMGSQS
jgi:DNA-binding NtrC family response regulator